jgi:glycosyltransferase involved in cell wall biosynthesis
LITVICPTYNEKNYILKVLEFFTHSKPDDKELLIIDGGSTDGTIGIVKKWCEKHSNIQLINNPNKTVPYALNLGIKSSNGDPIIRLDAHTEYEFDYFERILETFNKSGADIVGGPVRAVGKADFQKTVAMATSTVFGVGDSKIHKENFKGLSDHVYLGAWRRQLFSDIGLFNEQLIRNQDDELHYRAKSYGKKIYLNSEIKSYYYPRNTYLKLIIQYFQYGFFKPIVMFNVKSEIKIRHLIPSVFSIYMFLLPLAFFYIYYLIPLVAYITLDVYYSVQLSGRIKNKMQAFLVYPALHLSYGLGVIAGIFKSITVVPSKKIMNKNSNVS